MAAGKNILVGFQLHRFPATCSLKAGLTNFALQEGLS